MEMMGHHGVVLLVMAHHLGIDAIGLASDDLIHGLNARARDRDRACQALALGHRSKRRQKFCWSNA